MNKIRQYRESGGLAQEQVARLVGVTKQAICNLEQRDARPSIDTCRAIVAALNQSGVPCTLDDVFPPADASAA